MSITIDKNTIQKFDIPGPRYTSYPTAPIWSDSVGEQTYIEKLRAFGQSTKTLSLYIHIPFCQSMCTYCACNVVIRKQDDKYGEQYLNYLFKEIDLVAGYIGASQEVRQFHWGGGTPTYLNEDQIERLYHKVTQKFNIAADAEVAIEIDPRTIDKSKIKKLYDLGFNRISMGVQDFDPDVQKEVNRIQSFEMVKEYYDYCRLLGFNSVNFDLIYGLPNQTDQTFSDTVSHVVSLKPDRIALYSFAYVPWLKKHQNKINTEQLPNSDEKVEIFLNARSQFLEAGYQAIAMDHFALKDDELAQAFNKGHLHRNFMGYTTKPADEFIGLGVTSIGFLENSFIQSHKALPEYYRLLDQGQLPVERGKVLTKDDSIRQWIISSLMCHFKIDKDVFLTRFDVVFDEYFQHEQKHLQYCMEDGLIKIEKNQIKVTELGKIFIRNICMGFDFYLRQKGAHRRFSKTV